MIINNKTLALIGICLIFTCLKGMGQDQDAGVTETFTYEGEGKDGALVICQDSTNLQCVICGLPLNFCFGDNMKATIYPAGFRILNGKRYHCYDTNEQTAKTMMEIQHEHIHAAQERLDGLKDQLNYLKTNAPAGASPEQLRQAYVSLFEQIISALMALRNTD